MGRYLGKCKGVVGEIAVVGVKTRARAKLAMAATAATLPSSPAKKIKKVSKSSSTSSYDLHHQRNRRRNLSAQPENFVEKGTASSLSELVEEAAMANCSSSEVITAITTTTTTSSDFPPSCCSSNNGEEDDDVDIDHQSTFKKVVKDRLEKSVTDPEVIEGTEESSRCFDCHRTEGEEEAAAREASKSDGHESPTTKLRDTKSAVQNKMPSDEEIEEFFASAKKERQKHFIDKYNFDIVNDVPLEGRYEWVPLKP